MKKLFFLFIGLFIFCISFSFAQELDAPIKNDPNVKIGKLPNGMTYYLRENKKPEGRIEFRLAVNAGSMQENESQRGLAHFTEHMAFNGIEGYPGNQMISELQKIGVSFGREINAYTSFDETVFEITMPNNHLDMGLNILKGWANGLLYDAKEIDQERGVILEEYRMGLGADDRLRKKWFPVAFTNSRYAERIPIGLYDVITKCPYDTLRQFYKDWYRTDLQAIIIVGDFNIEEVEPMLIEKFGKIPAKPNGREKIIYPIENNKEPLAVVCSDPEATGNIIMLIRKHPHFVMNTNADFRKQLTYDLYASMYASRLSEMTQNPSTPFVGASAGYGNLIGNCDAYMGQVMSKENKITESLIALMKEDYRVLKYGFLPSEFERAKDEILNEYERRSSEVNKTESSRFASEYVQNFLRHDPIPGAKREYNYVKKYLPQITIDEINALAKQWITPENFVVVVTMPEKEGTIIPTEKEILSIMTDNSLQNVEPYVDNYKDRDILNPDDLKKGFVTNTQMIPQLDAKEITLSNGITVVMKQTNYKNDEILFAAESKGGTSLYYECDLPSLMFATDLVDRAGIAELDYSSLEKKMKGKMVGITPYIGQLQEGLNGSSNVKNLEFFFQYLHAFFTNPRYDTTVLSLVLSDTKEQMQMIKNQPMYKFLGALISAATQDDPYFANQLTIDNDYLDKVDYERAFQLYQQRFENPADFTFYFVGSFDEAELTRLIELYLGSLKTGNEKENFKTDVFKGFPKESIRKNIYFGQEDQSWVGLYFTEDIEWTPKNRMIVSQISEALQIELIETIREKMSGVYSPILQMYCDKYPTSEFQTMILFSCAPNNTDKLSNAVLKILEKFQKKGPKDETFQKVKQQLIMNQGTNLQKNNYWLNVLSSYRFNGDDLLDPNTYAQRVNAVSKEDIVNFMKQYFKIDHFIRMDMYPEKMKNE